MGDRSASDHSLLCSMRPARAGFFIATRYFTCSTAVPQIMEKIANCWPFVAYSIFWGNRHRPLYLLVPTLLLNSKTNFVLDHTVLLKVSEQLANKVNSTSD